jgi:hypothetical protein
MLPPLRTLGRGISVHGRGGFAAPFGVSRYLQMLSWPVRESESDVCGNQKLPFYQSNSALWFTCCNSQLYPNMAGERSLKNANVQPKVPG